MTHHPLAAMSPEEISTLFAQACNVGDIESLLTLYEAGACLLNPFGHRFIGFGSRGGGNMRNEVGKRFLAGFGEMDLIAGPPSTALLAPMSFRIVWRGDEESCRRKISDLSPAELSIFNQGVLDPNPTQNLNSRNLAEPVEIRGLEVGVN